MLRVLFTINFFRSLIVCRQRISIARIKALYGRIWNLYRVGESTVSCVSTLRFFSSFNPSLQIRIDVILFRNRLKFSIEA